jgi:beta-galactosidase
MIINRLLILGSFILASCSNPNVQRQETSLNGTWEFVKSGLSSGLPSSFNAVAPVPGLIDMAVPSTDVADTVYEDAVYWYKKVFRLEHPGKSVSLLKINKAKYHTRVYLNGVFVGENTYSFTPSLFDIKPFLKPGDEDNELIIAVGCKNNLPDTVTSGGDFEKTRYIPGIYDDVKIIQTGLPHIANIQIVPDIVHQKVRVVAEIETSPDRLQIPLSYTIREVSTGRVFTKGKISAGLQESGGVPKADFLIDMKGFNLWSPETPFLYVLELATKGDNKQTRFGMRSFVVSADSGVFLLNGKPYYLRGTNVTIFRFFEDPDRGGLPWDNKWATSLHLRFKDMHWNSIRYCIGFPPERWYEIADSLGFLIQDEYPLWTGGKGGFEASLPGVTPQRLAEEYFQWIRERQNHPSVVIWDAQNESVTDVTGKAIQIATRKRP